MDVIFFAYLSHLRVCRNIDYLERKDKQITNIKDGKFLITYSWWVQRMVFLRLRNLFSDNDSDMLSFVGLRNLELRTQCLGLNGATIKVLRLRYL